MGTAGGCRIGVVCDGGHADPRLAARPDARHSLETLARQRIFHMVCGYEDQENADTLRLDLLLKLVCGRASKRDTDDLASQPTLSRLEIAVGRARPTAWRAGAARDLPAGA